jgi:hypothetical protein
MKKKRPMASNGKMTKEEKRTLYPHCSRMSPPSMFPRKAGKPVPRERYRDMPRARRSGGTQLETRATAAGWKRPKQRAWRVCAARITGLNGKRA